MNRGQRRARWQAQFRTENAAGSAPVGAPTRATIAAVPAPRSPASPPRPQSVHLSIDELVLRGFERASTRAITDGLQRQLSALLAARGVPEGWTREQPVDDPRAQNIRVAAGAQAPAIGEQIAKAVFDARRGDRL